MQPRLRLFMLLALVLSLALPGAVYAEDDPPAPEHYGPFYGSAPYPDIQPPDFSRIPDDDTIERSPRASGAATLSGEESVALGQPGTSFRYVKTFGETGVPYFGDTVHLNHPYGVQVVGDRLWIAEGEGLRALEFSTSGTFIREIGKAGIHDNSGLPSLDFITDATVDADGNTWIVNSGPSTVLQLDSSGKLIKQIGSTWNCRSDNEGLCWPRGIAFGPDGRIFISDSGNNRVQVFDKTGQYQTTLSDFQAPEHLTVWGTQLYVADPGNHRVQIYDVRAGVPPTWVASLGATSGPNELKRPYGVAVSGSVVFVADAEANEIVVFQDGARARTIGTGWGDGPTQLKWPTGVALDAQGRIYVADQNNARVQVFDWAGNYVRTIGVTGTPYLTDGVHFYQPYRVAVGMDGAVYVVEWGRGQRLIKLDRNGAWQWTVGVPGVTGGWDPSDITYLNWPADVAVDSANKVYVVNQWNHKVTMYDAGGQYLGSFGSSGTGNEQFSAPRGIFVARDGAIYVADQDNHRVQIFDAARRYVATLGVTGQAGSDNAHFNRPFDIAVDSKGTIYVADRDNHRVQVFDAQRRFVRTIGVTGQPGDDYEHLNGPESLTVDAQDRLYIADGWSNRVLVFDRNGAFLTSVGGASGTRSGQLKGAMGVAVDAEGSVYVADYWDNSRIQKFALGVPGWRQVNINGFGDRYAAIESLASFQGALYAGGGKYIRRMDSSGVWTTVISDGFGDPSNVGIDHLIEFKGQLYAGTWTWVCDDEDCNTGHPTGGQVWRTANGTQWSKVVDAGFGDPLNAEVFRFVVFNEQLYAATWAEWDTHGAEIWRSSTGNPGDWTRVVTNGFGDPKNTGVLALAAHGGTLFAGTYNPTSGVELWRSANGSDWQQVNTDGFGDGKNLDTGALASFGGSLYAGTFNRTTGGQMWRCAQCDGSDWTRVVADGFGDVENRRVAALVPFNGALYAVTNNYYGNGAEVRRTTDGLTWTLAAPAGFGDSNNRGPYWGNSVTVANNRLYIGMANGANGAEVWTRVLTADFTATPTRGRPPLTVQFTNTSAGDYTSSLWDFGDGQTSAETNPTHTYAKAGMYTVKLTVGDGTDSDTVSRDAVQVGFTTFLPLVDRNHDPLMYDNFDDPQWDGAWNPAKWSPDQTATVYRQQGGALVVTEPASANPGGGTLRAIGLQFRSWKRTQLVEARLKVSSDRTGGWSPIGIALVDEDANGHVWYAACHLGANGGFSQASFGCSIFIRQGDNYPSEYETSGIPIDYDTWCTARIETDPVTGNVKFYLNNTLIGGHTPADAAALVASDQMSLMITNWGVHANSTATRYVDDVRITPAK